MSKTYNQLCADIVFDKRLDALDSGATAVMGLIAHTLRNSSEWRKKIESARKYINISSVFEQAMHRVDVGLETMDEMREAGIYLNMTGGVSIPMINDWIKNQNIVINNTLSIQKHVLLSVVVPSVYKKDENLYRCLVVCKKIQDRLMLSFPNNHTIRTAKAMAWVKDIADMVNIDGRTYHEIWDMFWNAHMKKGEHETIPFWKSVIQSPNSLRKHYDKIATKKLVESEKKELKKITYLTDEER